MSRRRKGDSDSAGYSSSQGSSYRGNDRNFGDGWDENDPRWNDPDWAGPGSDSGSGPGADAAAGGGAKSRSELQDSAQRLERAVEDLVRAASGAVSGKAARVVDELERSARRLRDQVAEEQAQAPGQGSDADAVREARMAGARRTRGNGNGRRPHTAERASRHNGWQRDLYREPDRGWIAGICAGLARYYQVEPWVARLVAFSLLLFIPQIVFWAYIIGIFMLRKRPAATTARSGDWQGDPGRSPAPEFGPRLAPRHGVRTLRVRFKDLEQRLRRLETHVTSREFTLQRELSALEREAGAVGAGRTDAGRTDSERTGAERTDAGLTRGGRGHA